MTKFYQRVLHTIALICCIIGVAKAQSGNAIDWQKFLGRNDMIFDTLTTKWEDGIFTGNGLLGTMLYMQDSNSIRVEIGRTDVTDHRADEMSTLYSKARLPIGHLVLQPAGRILKNTARLNLWNAETRGTVVTTKGTIYWRLLTLSQTDVIVLETKTTGGEKNFSCRFVAEESISPRTKFSHVSDMPKDYKANPPFIFSQKNEVDYCRQPMIAGGDYCTAWKEKANGDARTFYITVAINKRTTAVDTAIATIRNALQKNIASLVSIHREWWHQYYPESFVSLPDARMESFYWIQQYKIASATREGKPPLDLMGPWFRYTPWPAYWLNLNIQLTYSPLYTANRLSLANGLVQMIDDAKENLQANIPEPFRHNAIAVGRASGVDLFRPVKVLGRRDSTVAPGDQELGNLTWMLYYYWLHYRYTMDNALKAKLRTLLKQSINYYLDIMYKEDGKWHLPYTYSPEYPGGVTRDCNYDLSLFRWGCQTLLQLSPADSLAAKWKDVLQNLVEYPADKDGFRIGRDVAFNQSHRHYSHLLMIYPLSLLNWDQIENRELIQKSLERWYNFEGGLAGFSFTGGASMYAMQGDGDKALACLKTLVNRFVKPNTMYLETGPVMETPLAAASSIQDLLLQSWGDKIRVFPAVPHEWKDVAFENLRTEGAFLISAVRKNGETKWVRVTSLVGGPCIIRPGLNGDVKIRGAKSNAIKKQGESDYELQLTKGQTIILYGKEENLRANIGLNKVVGKMNSWGRKKQ